jgi:hypothetical protein
MVRRFGSDRSGQTAMADAVMALIILLIASGILYSAVAGAVTSSSEARQRADLKVTALETGAMPLEASIPVAVFTNLSSGEVHTLVNITGADLVLTLFKLDLHSRRTSDSYDVSELIEGIEELYNLVLEGRRYAVHMFSDVEGHHIDLFFASGQGTSVTSTGDIPHPRVVTEQTLTQHTMDVTVHLYLWK